MKLTAVYMLELIEQTPVIQLLNYIELNKRPASLIQLSGGINTVYFSEGEPEGMCFFFISLYPRLKLFRNCIYTRLLLLLAIDRKFNYGTNYLLNQIIQRNQ